MSMTSTDVRDIAQRNTEAIRAAHGGRRPKSETLCAYPRADAVHEAGLVGRREIIQMAGLDPDKHNSGPKWFHDAIAFGRFPPVDGQVIDGKPTWRRDTMLIHLYTTTRHTRRAPYLIPELWPEAEAALKARQAADMIEGVIRQQAEPQGGFRG